MTSQLERELETEERESSSQVKLSQDGEDSDSSSLSAQELCQKAPSASSCCFSCSQRGDRSHFVGEPPIPNAETVVEEGAMSGKAPKQVIFISGSQLSFPLSRPSTEYQQTLDLVSAQPPTCF